MNYKNFVEDFDTCFKVSSSTNNVSSDKLIYLEQFKDGFVWVGLDYRCYTQKISIIAFPIQVEVPYIKL